ncbi:MAG: nucleoside phosphorylase [Bacteroidales bacterium]|nr:nucleoside phosphorylase [Bacteroidales bacterium]
MANSKKIGESELILNPDGTIYHLHIAPENVADTVILVGDPGRVETISSYFDKVEFKAQNREIKTHTGVLNKVRLTVMSTGMGADNIDIVLNELDALANINFETRTVKEKFRSLRLIRLGTSGGLQPDIPLNAFIVSEYALGLDGVLHFYDYPFSEDEMSLSEAFARFAGWHKNLSLPYAIKPKGDLINKFGDDLFFKGITLTAPGFYGPQGRQLRLPLTLPGLNDKLRHFDFKGKRILNYEMETSALYGLGNMLGHQTLTVCVAIANRNRKEYNQNYKEAIHSLIAILLEKLTASK